MKYHLLLSFLSLLCVGCKVAQTNTEVPASAKTRVFLFAGQSNMDGRADGDDLSKEDLARLDKVASRIKFYYNHKPMTGLQLTEPSNYIKRKFSLTKAFGPELFFGIELAEQNPDGEFIFIKRAQGGTSLYGCWNPDWTLEKAALMKEENKPKLYQDFIGYTQEILGDKSEPYQVEAMFWVQEEADSGVRKWGRTPAASYENNLKRLIAGVRQETGVQQLPFIMFQVGAGKVVEGMKQATTDDPDVYLLPQSRDKSSDDYYAKNPPPIGHYTAKSMKVIGQRFYQIYASAKR